MRCARYEPGAEPGAPPVLVLPTSALRRTPFTPARSTPTAARGRRGCRHRTDGEAAAAQRLEVGFSQASNMESGSTEQHGHLGAAKQVQQSLEFAAIVGGGVELEGKSASIKSISDSIQSSNACSLSSCSSSLFSCLRSICRSIALLSSSILRSLLSSLFSCSAAGSRRQLSIRKNERKRDNDEPDAPLLGEWELALGEVDVVIGGKQSNQANNSANEGFQQGFAIESQPPPGRRRSQISRTFIHPKQLSPISIPTILVHAY